MKSEYYKSSVLQKQELHDERFWRCSLDPILGKRLAINVVKLGYSRWQRGKITQRKQYNSFGIELVTNGNALYTYKGNTHLVEPGSAFIKLPGNGHRYETGPAGILHKRFINVVGSDLAGLVGALGLSDTPVVPLEDPHWFIERLKECASLVSVQASGFCYDLSAQAYRIIVELARCAALREWPPGMREAVLFIQQNTRELISMDELKSAAGTTADQLYRGFAQCFGMPPMKYFKMQKMRAAQDLLLYGELSIKQIAYYLGYEDPFAFSTQFRKIVGMSPRGFKESTSPDYQPLEH